MSDFKTGDVDLSTLKIDKTKKSGAPSRGRKWLHLLWLLLPVVLFFGYKLTLKQIAPATKVKVATAQMLTGSEASAELVATGYVVAQVKAAVASKATGRLEVLNVEEGDVVKANQILAILDNADVKADLARTTASLAMARADSTDAAIKLNRASELIKTGATTQDIVDEVKSNYARAIASVNVALAGVRYAEVAVENTIIRAPFDGTVLSKDADVGEMVAPFSSAGSSRGAVVTLADMSSLEVEADVSESNLYKVRVGSPAEIVLDAYPNVKYPAMVKKIVPTADRSRATVLTKIAFTQIDDKVLPEMSARVNFLPDRVDSGKAAMPAVIAIPKSAVTNRDGRKVVYKVVGQNVVEVAIQAGRELGTFTEISSGIAVGDQVVLSPASGMKSGDKIELSQ